MKIRKLTALVLALVLVFGIQAGAIHASAEETWKENVLVKDPMGTFDIDLKCIKTVTFQDTLENVPAISWNMGKGASDKVKAWIEWDINGSHVFFAAEGGINGKESAAAMFKDMENLTEVNFGGAYHTDEAESLAEMFRNCYSLEKVDVETLNTANAESLYCMFAACRSLKELDVSGFDTAKATNLGHMFSGCMNLESLEVGGWDTAKVEMMEGVFGYCNALQTPDVSGWNLDSVVHYNWFMNWDVEIDGEPWYKLFN